MEFIIKNGSIVDVEKKSIRKLDIHVKDDIIYNIGEDINETSVEVIDADGNHIFPGFVDMHVHFREPGFEYKETIKTGSLAAAKGGYTSVAVMPNTKPVIDSIDSLDMLKKIISKDSNINILPIGSATIGEKGIELTDIEGLFKNGIRGLSDDGQPIMDKKLMEIATIKANELGIPIMIHSEDKRFVNDGCINEGEVSRKLGVRGISRKAENLMIARDIEIAKKLNLKIHICHVSTKEAIEMIRKAKKEGVMVTCEVAPHHFSITEEIVLEKKSNGKVNPPLRTHDDVEEIIKGIKDGTVDAIATDHAPHSEEEKSKDLESAPFGLSGIELAFPLTNTYLLEKGIIDIYQMIELMSLKPGNLLGIKGIGFSKGNIADITIVDMDEEFEVRKEDLVSKGKNTPFIGAKLKGKVKYTIVGGRIAYEE